MSRTRLWRAGWGGTLILLAAVGLSGCGKAGRPTPAGGAEARISYPGPQTVPTPARQKEDGRALVPDWDAEDLAQAERDRRVVVDPSVRRQFIKQTETLQRYNGRIGDPMATEQTDRAVLPPAPSANADSAK